MVFWRQRVTKVGQSAPELGHRPGYRRRSKGIGRCMAEGIVVTVFRWGHAAVLRLDDGRRLEGEQLAGDGRVNTSARRLHPSRPVTASPRRAPWRSTSLRSGPKERPWPLFGPPPGAEPRSRRTSDGRSLRLGTLQDAAEPAAEGVPPVLTGDVFICPARQPRPDGPKVRSCRSQRRCSAPRRCHRGRQRCAL